MMAFPTTGTTDPWTKCDHNYNWVLVLCLNTDFCQPHWKAMMSLYLNPFTQDLNWRSGWALG